MRRRSPWSTVASGVLLTGFSIWNFLHAYAPPDATPLHDVAGPIADVATAWVHHSSKGGGWDAPVVTISLGDGQAIRFTAHSRDEVVAAQPLGALRQGVSVNARADATGEIWELDAAGQPVVTLADTLERHRQLRRTRNLVSGLMLLVGLALGGYGFRAVKSGGS